MIRTLILALALAGCAAITPLPSPEAQIKAGADTVKGLAVSGTVALREHVISLNTAKSYDAILHTAGEALNGANADLVQCRKETGSNEKTSPDPCWPKVKDVIGIALQSITSVRLALAK